MSAPTRKRKSKKEEQEERLYYAVTHNDTEALNELIEDGVDVDSIFHGADPVTKSLWSALHICCEKGHYECAELLLLAGATADIRDKWGHTPLMYAVIGEWTEIVELLLQSGCKVDHKEQAGLTATHLAVQCSDNQCLRLLIQHSADLDSTDVMGATPLWKALCRDGNIEKIRMLVISGCDINQSDAKQHLTPLQAAIMHADQDRMAYIRLLVESGCDLTMATPTAHTPLMSALIRGWRDGDSLAARDAEVFHYLLNAGCDVDAVSNGDYRCRLTGTVLKLAAERGTLNILQELLLHGADINKPDEKGVTPLMGAVMTIKPECVQLLTQHGCHLSPECRVRVGDRDVPTTPFKYAVLQGDREITRHLVLAGVDANAELAVLTNEELDRFLAQEDFLNWLNNLMTGPLSLSSSCRSCIRKTLCPNISTNIEALPLPESLKAFLLMQDLP